MPFPPFFLIGVGYIPFHSFRGLKRKIEGNQSILEIYWTPISQAGSWAFKIAAYKGYQIHLSKCLEKLLSDYNYALNYVHKYVPNYTGSSLRKKKAESPP